MHTESDDRKVIVRMLMQNHDLTLKEALVEFHKMREAVMEGEDPEELLHEIGLEPDYIMGLI